MTIDYLEYNFPPIVGLKYHSNLNFASKLFLAQNPNLSTFHANLYDVLTNKESS